MFINHMSIDIAFRLINFAVLAGLAFFLFKKYVKADLLLLIDQKKIAQQALYTQQITLEKQQNELDTLAKIEATICQNFQVKIDEWNKVVTHEYNVHAEKQKATMALAKQRSLTIALKKEDVRIRTHVATTVIADLTKSLSLDFKDPRANTHYLESIIRFMNETKL